MRRAVQGLCHGGDRKPLEPYGVLAPFLRSVAWLLLFTGAAAALVALVAVRLGWVPVIAPSIVVGGTAPVLAAGVRWLAGAVRPAPIPAVARDWTRS